MAVAKEQILSKKGSNFYSGLYSCCSELKKMSLIRFI